MIFSAVEFVFIFLPAAYAVLFLVARFFGRDMAILWLVAASLFFYGWWDWNYLGLIAASILVNYFVSLQIRNDRTKAGSGRLLWLVFGIVSNVAALAYFKYFDFIVEMFGAVVGQEYAIEKILLPLAISFFTFQQIAYLVDNYTGEADVPRFLDYCLFVTFFPQLIIGPIVKYTEMLPQFRKAEVFAFDAKRLAAGLSIFLIGLSKKVLIADQVAPFVGQVFGGASAGADLSFYAAWFGVVSFAVQVYFDFSGYADMAVGLAAMIGIVLPVNFYSPYKAKSLIELWRNWHITLTRFLRQYIYYPLGGRHPLRAVRYFSMITTMTISGIWHGAGWPFVLWGFSQGVLLTVNHAFNHACRSIGLDKFFDRHALISRPIFVFITFVAFLFGLVVFRADSFSAGVRMYEAMFGLNGFQLPIVLTRAIPGLDLIGTPQAVVPFFPVASIGSLVEAIGLVGGGLFIAFFLPNVYQMSMRLRLISIGLFSAWTLQKILFSWGASPFIYFQF